MQSYCYLQSSRIQAYSQNEIINMIPVNILNEIKQKDQHPFFQVYSIAHEGISNPRLMDMPEEQSKPIHWTRKAIQSIKNIVLKGVKCFKGHNPTNDNQIKENEVGEVIHNFEKEINGKLHHLAITYHPKDKVEVVKSMDACSHEGFWNFIVTPLEVIAETIDNISGIALIKSNEQKPGFADAKRQGFVQAFAAGGDSANKGGGEPPKQKEREMTLKDVIDYVRLNKVHPSQLEFTLEDMRKDREFKEFFDKVENLEKDKTKLEEDKKVLETENLNMKKENQKSTAVTRLLTLSTELQLTDKQKDFVKKSFEEDIKEIEDLSDDSIKKYINIQTKALARALGETSVDTPVSTTTDNIGESGDYTKSENNEFLNEDIDLSDFS